MGTEILISFFVDCDELQLMIIQVIIVYRWLGSYTRFQWKLTDFSEFLIFIVLSTTFLLGVSRVSAAVVLHCWYNGCNVLYAFVRIVSDAIDDMEGIEHTENTTSVEPSSFRLAHCEILRPANGFFFYFFEMQIVNCTNAYTYHNILAENN